MTNTNNLPAQQLDSAKVKTFEHQLDNVMEITDTTELKKNSKKQNKNSCRIQTR